MEFLKSFFPSSLVLQLRKRISSVEPQLVAYSCGVFAILSYGKVYLLTTCLQLLPIQDTLEFVEKIIYITKYLWIIGQDIRIYDTSGYRLTTLESGTLIEGQDKVIIIRKEGVQVYSSNGSLEISIPVTNGPVVDVIHVNSTLFIGQESLITVYDLKVGSRKEIATLELLKLSYFRDKIVAISRNKIRFYKLQETFYKKNSKEFQVSEFQNIVKVFSTLKEIIVVSKEKISVFSMNQKKELVSVDIVFKSWILDVFLKDEELLVIHGNAKEKEFSTVHIKQEKIEQIGISQFELGKRVQEALQKRFCNCDEFVRGEYQQEKIEISGFLSRNTYFSDTKEKSLDLLALLLGKTCQIWDPWSKQVLTSLDFSEYFRKTEVERLIFNSRYLLVIGGTSVLVYRFTTSVDIEMAKKIELDMEMAMASLDNVVDSALNEANNVKKLLCVTERISSKVDGETAQDNGEYPSKMLNSDTQQTKIEPQAETSNSELITSEKLPQDDDTRDADNIFTVGNLITEMYEYNPSVAGWYPLCKIIASQTINHVIVNLENDLIAIHSKDRELMVGIISNPAMLLSVDVQGEQSILLMSFAKLFLSHGQLSQCIICITLDGTISALKIETPDRAEIFTATSVIIRKNISDSPVAVYVLDENGHLQPTSTMSQELSLICVFKQSIRIFVFRQNGSHEMLREKRTDSKDGMIVASGVFVKESGSFLGVLFTSGILLVYCLPGLSVAFKGGVECDIRFIEDCFISSCGCVYVWSSLEKLDIYEFILNEKEEESNTHVFTLTEQKNTREALKNIVRKRHGGDNMNIDAANSSINNELQMKMNERGEALQELETKLSDLSAGTSDFLKKIKDYNEKQVGYSTDNSRRKSGGNSD